MRAHRRQFLKTSAVAGTALSLTAASYAKVAGANGKMNIAFVGVGGRCQQHVDVILLMKKLGKAVEPFAVCDVWDGDQTKGKGKGQGLYPTAKRCGIPEGEKSRVTKDYRVILENKDVDVVTIATPDHWHAKQTVDAMNAGKDVYCEKPMTRTIEEAQAVVDVWKKTGKIMSVGVQSMADPTWTKAYEYIKSGGIGHVMQAQTRYYRNSDVGQWRYYNLTKTMNPTTIDWDTFLGHKHEFLGKPIGPKPEEQPFDRAVYAQWRCYWPFGGGMFTDLFVHQVTHLIQAMGVRYPRRVVGGGGLYFEFDTRDVPDVAMVCADYDEGCQMFVTATMCNDYPIDECIRGKTGTIRFVPRAGDLMTGFEVIEQKIGAARGPGDAAGLKGELIKGDFQSPAGLDPDKEPNPALTYALWENYLNCVAARNQGTLSTPELGAAAFSTVNMGVLSYRSDKALYWDAEQRKPVDGDGSWAAAGERKSKARAKVSNIKGWAGGDKGCTFKPTKDQIDYMKMAGPWTGGKDPAGD
jgi:predicted dehydrogenase